MPPPDNIQALNALQSSEYENTRSQSIYEMIPAEMGCADIESQSIADSDNSNNSAYVIPNSSSVLMHINTERSNAEADMDSTNRSKVVRQPEMSDVDVEEPETRPESSSHLYISMLPENK